MSMSTTDENLDLIASPPLRRLTRHLHDIIRIAFETSTNIPSKSLYLTRLQYVSDEKLDGKFCMHFAALVRDQEHGDAITINLTFTAEV